MKHYLAFDVGGSAIKTGVVTENGDIVDFEKLPVADDWKNFKKTMVEHYIKCSQKLHICGIGISSCGNINPATGAISPSLASSLKYCIGQSFFELKEYIPLPISVQKDGACAALAEMWTGMAKEAGTFVTFVLGSGLGGAVIIDKKVYTGVHNLAGDVGYTFSTVENKNYSGFLAPGCVERLYTTLTGRTMRLAEIYHNKDMDPAAESCYKKFIEGLADLLLSAQYIIDPEFFLLCGGITEWPEFLPLLRGQINSFVDSRKNGILVPRVELGKHLSRANLIGAVYHHLITLDS